MKKIVFLLLCLTFSMSVSAHQPKIEFQNQIASKALIMEGLQTPTSMYTTGNGGIIQLIYNIFYKVGNVISTTLNDDDTPVEEETTSEN